MLNNGLQTAKHNVTGIVSNIPESYFTIYPDTYVPLDEAGLAQHYLELEEDKVVYALDAAVQVEEKPAKHAAKKEGK